jgi:TusA-related sulfurtransferase
MPSSAPDLSSLRPDHVVDARGTRRPGPVLAAKRALGDVSAGGVLEVLATDATALAEVPSWSGKVGVTYLGAFEDASGLHLFLRKTG